MRVKKTSRLFAFGSNALVGTPRRAEESSLLVQEVTVGAYTAVCNVRNERDIGTRNRSKQSAPKTNPLRYEQHHQPSLRRWGEATKRVAELEGKHRAQTREKKKKGSRGVDHFSETTTNKPHAMVRVAKAPFPSPFTRSSSKQGYMPVRSIGRQ